MSTSCFRENPSLENRIALARETKDDERGRGASIASPFNDDDDDAGFETKSFHQREFRSSLFEKEESFE